MAATCFAKVAGTPSTGTLPTGRPHRCPATARVLGRPQLASARTWACQNQTLRRASSQAPPNKGLERTRRGGVPASRAVESRLAAQPVWSRRLLRVAWSREVSVGPEKSCTKSGAPWCCFSGGIDGLWARQVLRAIQDKVERRSLGSRRIVGVPQRGGCERSFERTGGNRQQSPGAAQQCAPDKAREEPPSRLVVGRSLSARFAGERSVSTLDG